MAAINIENIAGIIYKSPEKYNEDGISSWNDMRKALKNYKAKIGRKTGKLERIYSG